MNKDQYQGQGGDFEIDPVTRERKRKGEPPRREPEGGGARDKDGKPLVDRDKDGKPLMQKVEPALPAPAKAPWDEQPAAPQSEQQPKKKGA